MKLATNYAPVPGHVGNADEVMIEFQRHEQRLNEIDQQMISDAGVTFDRVVDGATDPRSTTFWVDDAGAPLLVESGGIQTLSATLDPDAWQPLIDTGTGDPLTLSFTLYAPTRFNIYLNAYYANKSGLYMGGTTRVVIDGRPGSSRSVVNGSGLAASTGEVFYLVEQALLQPGPHKITAEMQEQGSFASGAVQNALMIAMGRAA